jgi:DNA-binding IclR family transcriptional regulator
MTGSGSTASNLDTSAGKALAILDAFTGVRAVLGISEIAVRVDLPKSTTHRLLGVLVDSGYVRRVDDRYALSLRAFELGSNVQFARPNGLRTHAMPYMAELLKATGETVHLGILSGTDILYIEKLFGSASTRCNTFVGFRRPAYATGLGKAILAYATASEVEQTMNTRYRRITPYTIPNAYTMDRALSRVRDEGCATDFEESFSGLSCLAVPLVHPKTRVAVGALSVTTRAVGDQVVRFKARMMAAAEQLSAELATFSI